MRARQQKNKLIKKTESIFYFSGIPGQGGEDPFLHVNKRELIGGALLLGAGVIKGVIATSLFNSLSGGTGIQIGKK